MLSHVPLHFTSHLALLGLGDDVGERGIQLRGDAPPILGHFPLFGPPPCKGSVE